jgi:hypothetical protein
MDFTSVFLKPKGSQGAYVKDCIFVLEWVEGDQRRRLHCDYLCDCPDTNQNDYHFLLHAVLHLFREQQLQRRFDLLLVWSNGGGHHFKTCFCQWM